MKHPLVSICIPTYNGERFIAEALESAIAQTYPNIEIIVSDDASNDATLQIIKSYNNKTKIPIKIFNHLPKGIGANWNNSIKKASGKYIKFLFQDDVLEPTCITEMITVMEADASVGLVASKRDFIIDKGFLNNETKVWIDNYGDLQNTLKLNFVDGQASIDTTLFSSPEFFKSPLNKIGEPTVVLFTKEIVKKLGYFDESLKQILDYEFWYRILKHKKIIVLENKLVSFRLHAQQATNVNRAKGIPDYDLYEKILYKGYLKLLNPKKQVQLLKKYRIGYRLYDKCMRKIKGE
jgi:glycosyltransferase involved in cell wall biosynthesis